MTEAADCILTNGRIYTLASEERVSHRKLASRDGTIIAIGSDTALKTRIGLETNGIDCEGQVVLPRFIDAHMHIE